MASDDLTTGEDSLAALERLGQAALAEQRIQIAEREALRKAIRQAINLCREPAWCKVAEVLPDGEMRFRMLAINAAYTALWGVSSEEYEGQLDATIWGPEFAAAFHANDMEAVALGGVPLRTREKVPDVPELHAVNEETGFLLWPVAKVSAHHGPRLLVQGRAYPPNREVDARLTELFMARNFEAA